jgi:transcriptional regulator with XRE-family HTH domain
MANDEQQRPLAAIVGERLKAFRAVKGLRQADIAGAAEKWGLPWARSSIAALEAGTRNLSLEEALLLPLVIADLGGWDEPLLPPDSVIEITPTRILEARYLGLMAGNLTEPVEVSDSEGGDPLGGVSLGVRRPGQVEADPDDSLYSWQLHAEDQAWDLFCARVYPGMEYRRNVAHGKNLGSDRELIGRVSKKIENPIGGPASYGLVNILSWVLWKAPFEVERDRRTGEKGELSDRARQSAKGHVTREMINEMQVEASTIWDDLNALFGELVPIWNDAEKLVAWSEVARRQANQLRSRERRSRDLQIFEADYPEVSLLLEEIGESLRVARLAAGLAVQDVAKAIRVYSDDFTSPIVEGIESGKYLKARPKRRVFEYILAFAQAVGLDGELLVRRLDEAWVPNGGDD